MRGFGDNRNYCASPRVGMQDGPSVWTPDQTKKICFKKIPKYIIIFFILDKCKMQMNLALISRFESDFEKNPGLSRHFQ